MVRHNIYKQHSNALDYTSTHLFEREDEGLVKSEEQPGWKKKKEPCNSAILT